MVAPQRALGAANRRARSRLSEGDETQKYAVESRRAAVYRVAHAKHSTPFRAPLYAVPSTTLYRVEGRDFTPQPAWCQQAQAGGPFCAATTAAAAG